MTDCIESPFPTAPTAPRDVHAKNISTTSADLCWTLPQFPNGPINEYRVVVWEVANDTNQRSLRLNDTSNLELSLTQLLVNTEYNMNITAVNVDSKQRTWISPVATGSFTTGKYL